jgi:zinc/manganese transport system substrate-binding protein
MINRFCVLAAIAFCGFSAPAFADPVKVVAAENFYGDIVSQIGGANVAVTSILNSPDDDPHLFEVSPSTAKALSDATIVIANGVDYDPWMEKLLGAHKSPGRKEIVVGSLVGRKGGDNPHLWYDPAYMKAVATALVADLIAVDPAHKADYERGEAKFLESLKPLDDKIAMMRKSYAGQPVTASEPVFFYQAKLIGLIVRNEKYALAIMNNAEPTPSQVAAFENDLKGRKVKAMLYNAQASEPAVGKLVQMAKDNSVPVVGVSETEPPNSTYQDWMMGQLNALDRALSGGA